jgi:hypothetical protein
VAILEDEDRVMGEKFLKRRSFLLSTAGLGGVFALIARSGAASAFSIEQLPGQSKLALAAANHCSESAAHGQILAKLEQDLAHRSGAPGTLLAETEYCPLCGCPIIATRQL